MSDTLISSLDTVGFSLPRVVLVLSHDQQYVWFVPKVAPSKHWVAKILVEVLVAHDLADIGKKNELELARVHWHAKEMATIQTKTNLWVMTKILVRCTLATIQTHPNTRLVEDARGAATRPRSGVARPTASSGPETMPGRLAFSMTCGDRIRAKGISNVATTATDYPGTPKPSSLAPSRGAFPASASCSHSCRPFVCRR